MERQLPNRKINNEPLTAPKQDAEFVQAANVFHNGINLFLNICNEVQ